MAIFQPLRNWVDEFLPYKMMETMGVWATHTHEFLNTSFQHFCPKGTADKIMKVQPIFFFNLTCFEFSMGHGNPSYPPQSYPPRNSRPY